MRICCCCGHNLVHHIDEVKGWRCHSLSKDGYQCECYLRKDRCYGKDFYNLYDRIKEHTNQIKETARRKK